MSILSNPTLIALAAALPSLLLGYFGFRHAQRIDGIAEKSGLAVAEDRTSEMTLDGLKTLIAVLQSDNAALREHIKSLNGWSRHITN